MNLFILVPAYNEEKVLKSVIYDLKKLKFKDIQKEIVVINDGSTDETEEIARHSYKLAIWMERAV